MKKNLFLLLLFFCTIFITEPVNAQIFCMDNFKQVSYCINDFSCSKKIYNSLIIPYLSSVLNNKNPLFIKLTIFFNTDIIKPFDDYNWKISQIDLIRCI